MASPFIHRRKAKRVGREPGAAHDYEDEDTGPVVRKPLSSTPRTKSKLRLSFNPGEAGAAESDGRPEQKPKTTTSDRNRSLFRQSWGPGTPNLAEAQRPTYSKDHLSELRSSTPSTPKDLSTYASSAEDDPQSGALDIASKFGEQSTPKSNHIPSASEIREKKERRTRLAKEQGAEDFIALEDHDSDGEFRPQRMQVSTFLRQEQEKDTRLVHDDEDIAEGFDNFVEDAGRVTLSKRGKRMQEQKEREAMREMILDAEDSSEESDSEAERNYAYEASQTRKGMDGLSVRESKKPQQPRDITPIPKLAAVLSRFREGIQGLDHEKVRLEKLRADIKKEKMEVKAREENIQQLLVETGERFERLRRAAETTSIAGTFDPENGNGNRSNSEVEILAGKLAP